MNRDEAIHRFEELDAGRALGDLDAIETAEWTDLAKRLGRTGDAALERLAAEMENSATPRIAMPPALAAKIKASIPASTATPLPAADPVATPFAHAVAKPSRPAVPLSAWLGWAAAACLAILLGITHFKKGAIKESSTDVAAQRLEELKSAPDLRRLPFAAASPTYGTVSGTVEWSDAIQQGAMTLSNLRANNPEQQQYQLWIVDPTRDDIPVDGGVFDIPAGPGPVVIPIHAKLAVRNPAAFVITVERPGGVVRSKQEIVVAVAKS